MRRKKLVINKGINKGINNLSAYKWTVHKKLWKVGFQHGYALSLFSVHPNLNL
jgi:hypothetical protein